MNFKKLKLWKLLAVGGVVGLVATVPIITTACSSTTEENNGNVSPENVTDRFVYNNNISQAKPLEIVDSFQNLVNPKKSDNGGKPIAITTELLNNNLSDLINKENDKSANAYKKELIVNYEKIKDKIGKITIHSQNQNSDKWGTKHNWPTDESTAPKVIVYYHFNREPISIKSVSDLKNQLTSKLGEIMNQSLIEIAKKTYKDFQFVNDSALLIEKSSDNTYDDYLKMHVEATNTTTNNKEYIELRLPVSDINYVPQDVKISITAKPNTSRNTIPNLENIPSFVKFNVGINRDYDLSSETTNNEVTVDKSDPNNKKYSTTIKGPNLNTDTSGFGKVTADSLIKQLNWNVKSSDKKSINKNNDLTTIGDSMINDYKVGESLQMFNVDFKEISVKGNNDSSAIGYTGEFSLNIKGQPKLGYYWNDKKENGEKDNSERVITINNFSINLADAEVNRDIPFHPSGNDNSKTWSYTPTMTDFTPTNQTDLDTWLKDKNNIAKLEDEINKKAISSQWISEKSSKNLGKKNIGVKYKIKTTKSSYKELSFRNAGSTPQEGMNLRFEVVLLPGHILKEPNQANGLGEFDVQIIKTQ